MTDFNFALIGLILVILVTTIFILYWVTTNRIIKDQEKEIVELRGKIMQLEGYIRKHKITDIQKPNDVKFGE